MASGLAEVRHDGGDFNQWPRSWMISEQDLAPGQQHSALQERQSGVTALSGDDSELTANGGLDD